MQYHKRIMHLAFAAAVCSIVVIAGAMSRAVVEAAAPTVRLYVAPSKLSIQKGQTFKHQIRLEKTSSDKVDYVDARVRFAVNQLEIVGVSRSGSAFTNDNGPTISYVKNVGAISISGQRSENLATPSDVLVATITFRAKATGSSTVYFSSESQAGDLVGRNNVKDYLDQRSSGVVSISNPPVAPPPPSTPPSVGVETDPSTSTATPKPTEEKPDEKPAEDSDSEPKQQDPELILPIDEPNTSNALEPEAANQTETRSFSFMNWLWVIVVGFAVVGAVAASVYRRVVSQRIFLERVAYRNVLALGGTAMYAAEYIAGEREPEKWDIGADHSDTEFLEEPEAPDISADEPVDVPSVEPMPLRTTEQQIPHRQPIAHPKSLPVQSKKRTLRVPRRKRS